MTHTSIPAYAEIAAYLRERVSVLSAGARLPSDAELSAKFQVSRMTARQAVQVLAQEGLLYRERGRGTFVAKRTVPRLLGSPLSFTESMRRRGLVASSRVLAFGWVTPTPDDVVALELEAGEEAVLLERLRFAGDVPMAIERAVLSPTLAVVLEHDLGQESLHDVFESLGRVPVRAAARVTARQPGTRERGLLRTAPDEVLLCEARIISDADGRPLEHTETAYAASRYEFEVVLHRDGNDVMEQ